MQLSSAKRARKILLSTQVVTTGTIGLAGPILTIYAQRLGGEILTAAGSYAIFGVVFGLLVMLFGKLTDRTKEKEYFLIFGFFLAAVGNIGYIFASKFWHLFVLQALFGIALAIMTPANDALYTQHLDGGKYAYEWGVWETVDRITDGLSVLASGFIVVYLSFNTLFLFMAAFCFLAGIFIWFLPRRTL